MRNEFLAAMVRQPQSTWLRRGLFQIHLWTGVSIGLYVVVATVSGSALVYKAKLNALFIPPTVVTPSGPLKSEDELRQSAQEQFPPFQVGNIEMPRRPDRPAVVTLVAPDTSSFGCSIHTRPPILASPETKRRRSFG